MLFIRGLEFHYPNSRFHMTIPELHVKEGEKVAVIGASGSGKTTLLNLIAGIMVADSGQITVDSHRVDALGDARRRDFRITHIGFIFQDFQLLDYLSVLDNILHPYRISRVLRLTSRVRQRAEELAQQMDLTDKLKRYPQELSQGEQQRAAICRALLPEPRMILADEATGNLDPGNKTRILDLLFHCVELDTATLLAVTHDHELLPRFDRVVNFKDFHSNTPA